MSLSYKFYRRSFFKVAILSVVILAVALGRLSGPRNPNEDPTPLIFIGVILLAANIGLYVAMRKAKRREETENRPPKR